MNVIYKAGNVTILNMTSDILVQIFNFDIEFNFKVDVFKSKEVRCVNKITCLDAGTEQWKKLSYNKRAFLRTNAGNEALKLIQ